MSNTATQVIRFLDAPCGEYTEVEVRYVHTLPFNGLYEMNRTEIRRADNGRLLGWLGTAREWNDALVARRVGYTVHVAPEAFRGSGVNDIGDLLDDVPTDLHNSERRFESPSVGTQRLRRDAVADLLAFLAARHAPALGYGPHWRVQRWADRHQYS